MTNTTRAWTIPVLACLSALLISATATQALQVRPQTGRFDKRVIPAPTNGLDVATTPVASLSVSDTRRADWDSFRTATGASWSVYLDRRSGAPLLAEGSGISWEAAKAPTIDTLAASLRTFIAAHQKVLLADDAELVLDRDASGEILTNVWQIVFTRAVAGVPVDGERYLFTIGHGNLISFGSPRWTRIDVSPVPEIDAAEAQTRLAAYMALTPADTVERLDDAKLELIPLRAGTKPLGAVGKYAGTFGAGYTSALVWRVALRVTGEPGTWVGLVDAHSGEIRSLVDDTRYARVKGGVYPISDDQQCPDGCEQSGYPMPFADITINAATQNAGTLGVFSCSPAAATGTSTLNGQYVRVLDTCGPISQSVSCSADIDLQQSGGADCAVPAGASAGNTHSARSSFYHLNRIAEHARTWLPTRTWLNTRLVDKVNLNQSCNAYWDGSAVNFFRSSAGCNNTGELAGVFLHEWGHGLDQNDGGNFDNPSEAYADITSFMQTHVSCIGRGFFKNGNCGGYGNSCLTCTGVRDQDWDHRVNHTPSTPADFGLNHCSGGGGPCGLEEHCEGYISGEALWDFAARDLPATGLDPASAWQLADKLWYKSRLGSGGDAYNCALPDSDGCSANSWFEKLRTADDDDGNLANGTPHAAAIFAALDRHKIACGAVDDPSNQNSTTCPAIAAPAFLATAGATSAALSWTPVANAIGYRLLRNDTGCQAAMTRLTVLTGSSYTDAGLINGFPLYYTIQAIGANAACDGNLSSCVAVTPQSNSGVIKLDASSYTCTGQVNATVTDANIGADTTTIALSSPTETATETMTLTRITPGSATYAGSMTLTRNAPVHNGVLSVGNGDLITARYIDANDGAGHMNLQRVATASVTCAAPPSVKPVPDGTFGTAMTSARADGSGATIALTWDVSTCASPDHHLLYGDLAGVASLTVTGSVCDLGATGTATWSGAPAGDLWYVVVGDDNGSTEGSWGTDSQGAQEGGATASGQCSLSARDNSGVCP